RVGATEEERRRAQAVAVTLEMEIEGGLRGLGDDLGKTVDYFEVSEVVRDLAAEGERVLIETLAEEVADTVIERFGVVGIEVEVEKFVLVDAESVSVRLRREK
ncbi:MAG: dihydroneopterin aldolase, partial [Verrucomicrobiales bacterium]|nr:dihydroneopterin aldolase [Verrucomicrobiales bacterium]